MSASAIALRTELRANCEVQFMGKGKFLPCEIYLLENSMTIKAPAKVTYRFSTLVLVQSSPYVLFCFGSV